MEAVEAWARKDMPCSRISSVWPAVSHSYRAAVVSSRLSHGIAKRGAPKPLLENRDINALAGDS